LLPQQGKLPWELTQADFEAHMAWMRAQGYSANYIAQTLGVLANFYRWCAARQVDAECPPGFNPAACAPRPKYHPIYGGSLLSQAELEKLLGYMQRDDSPPGRRDYAFCLARLRLGVPLYSLQKLRWGQIDGTSPEGAWVRWRPEAEPARLPEEVWAAMREWLAASGRLAGMREGDYLFTPLVDPLQREPSDRAEAWDAGRYLSVDGLADHMRLYGLRLGIDKQKLTSLALRRTALRLRLDTGESPEQMRAFMDGQGRVRNTRRLMELLPRLPPDPPGDSLEPALPQRKSIPYPPGAGLKHGLFAHSQPPEQVLEILSEDIQGIEAELAGLRLLGRGLLELQAQRCSSKQRALLAQAYTLVAARLAMMVEAEKHLEQAGREGRQEDLWAEEFLAMLDRMDVEDGSEPFSAAFRAEALGGEPELALTARALVEEVAAMRLVLRNTLDQADEARQIGDIGEYTHLVDIYSKGCNRLLRLMRAGPVVHRRLVAHLKQVLETAIEEVTQDWVKF
jgi:hypothetical protein